VSSSRRASMVNGRGTPRRFSRFMSRLQIGRVLELKQRSRKAIRCAMRFVTTGEQGPRCFVSARRRCKSTQPKQSCRNWGCWCQSGGTFAMRRCVGVCRAALSPPKGSVRSGWPRLFGGAEFDGLPTQTRGRSGWGESCAFRDPAIGCARVGTLGHGAQRGAGWPRSSGRRHTFCTKLGRDQF